MKREELNKIRDEMDDVVICNQRYWDGYSQAISDFYLRLQGPVQSDLTAKMIRDKKNDLQK